MTICSTCQGVMGQAEKRLTDPDYRASVNADLAEEGLSMAGASRSAICCGSSLRTTE